MAVLVSVFLISIQAGAQQKGVCLKVNGEKVLEKPVGKETATDGWMTLDVDLGWAAGKTINLELVNEPSGWENEAAYWAEIAIK